MGLIDFYQHNLYRPVFGGVVKAGIRFVGQMSGYRFS